ncbi:hypothetical protein D9M71_773530 [compost metagenome]
MTYSFRNHIVISFRWSRKKLYTTFFQFSYSMDDIFRSNRDVLYAFSFVEIKIFFYLRFLFTLCRFVDREFCKSVSVGHYFRHQCRIFCIDLLVVKRKNIYKSHYLFIPFYCWDHSVPVNISYAVVYIQ